MASIWPGEGCGSRSGSAGAGPARYRQCWPGSSSAPPRSVGRVVVRAVAGAVQHLQPGVLLQVGGDLAGVVDAVVVADHRGHRERGNARSTWSSSVVKSAAQRRPSRYTQRPVLTSIAPNTVTCRFVPGWGSAGGRCAVSSWPARAAAGSGGPRLRRAPRPGGAVLSAEPRSWPRRGHGPVAAGGQPGPPAGLQNCHRS